MRSSGLVGGNSWPSRRRGFIIVIQALQKLIGAPDMAICLLDKDRQIVTCNGAMGEIAGTAPGQLIGQSCCQVLHGVAESVGCCPFSRMFESGKPETGMVRIGERSMETTTDPLFDASGRIVNVLHTFRDPARQSEARESLIRLQKLEHLADISRGIAHDLNNLLSMAVGMLSLMKDSETAAAKPSHVCGMQAAMDRATDLCRRLMSVSTSAPSHKSVVSLAGTIRESAELGLMGTSHRLLCDIDEGLWPCLAQKEQIAQIVVNLVMNARQASEPGRAIRVEARNVREPVGHLGMGAYVKILVQDSGTGIARSHIENIFKPFFTTKESGTGLGLATVDSIVRAHMGHVRVDSEAGTGTTFTVYLPAADPALAGTSGSDWEAALRAGCFCMDMVADTKEGVIAEMVDHMCSAGKLKDRRAILNAVMDRERSMSTGMQHGIALPHGRARGVEQTVICLGAKREGVEFASLDGLPAKIFAMTISPLDDTGLHVRYLGEMSRLLSNASIRDRILKADSPPEIVEILISRPAD